MRRLICVILQLLFLSGFCLAQAAAPASTGGIPVLVELFTSEGCSTCPPADRFLGALDGQPIPGTEIIVLSEHVDYWDHLGWKDPYSSRELTERQEMYARQFKLASAYTPQMVVDGVHQLSGADAKEASTALRDAVARPKAGLSITNTSAESSRIRARIECAALSSSQMPGSLDVYVALALNRAENQVTRGENANHHLTHTAVVRKLARIGKMKAGESFSHDVDLKIDDKTTPDNLRVVTFLQDPSSGKVFGAAMKNLDATKQ